ncbi:hypothetical protein [Opitutus sp. GAS368]|uniref:hypothetical protein n=1 Tax=Opitutus sp. GAS368 TaxID=1882749 RepID=UPI0012FE7A3E|nr:hypothetical protein [Opitutus sp. GAS368]
MTTHVNYRDIPKEERKRLESEAIHRTPRLRTVRFAAVFLPVLFSGLLANYIVPSNGPFLSRLAVVVVFALILGVSIWETLGRPRLKIEVEKLKNA